MVSSLKETEDEKLLGQDLRTRQTFLKIKYLQHVISEKKSKYVDVAYTQIHIVFFLFLIVSLTDNIQLRKVKSNL